jgi:hypothetical protein
VWAKLLFYKFLDGAQWLGEIVITKLSDFGSRGALDQVTVSWIGVVLFWWFGASGLSPELVAKPASFGFCQGR